MANLVKQLKAVKEREGFTYPQLSRALGVHEITICRWCMGQHPPRGELVRRSLERFLKRHNGR